MSFKSILMDDVKGVFLNGEEFAEQHVIDGKLMTVSVDGNEVVERSKKQVEEGRSDGLYERQTIIYVSKKDFGKVPAIGRQLTMDKGIYIIQDCIDEGGMYSITLGAIRA